MTTVVSMLLVCICASSLSARTSQLRTVRGSVCGSDGMRYVDECAFVLATCKPHNRRFDNIVPVSMKFCEAESYTKIPKGEKALVCGVDGITYQACMILKRRCAKEISTIIPLHLGACNNCSKENVCDWWKMDAVIEDIARTKICAGDQEYEDRCAFYMARCLQYKKDKSVLKTRQCVSKPEVKRFGKPIRIKKGSICGSDRRKYENFCTFMHATCRPNNRSHDRIYPLEMKYCEDESLTVPDGNKASLCGTNGLTYQACQLGLQICDRRNSPIIPLHLGKCGICTRSNICAWEEMEAIIAVQEGRNKICANGVTYETKCEFSIARCKHYNVKKTILNPERCAKTN